MAPYSEAFVEAVRELGCLDDDIDGAEQPPASCHSEIDAHEGSNETILSIISKKVGSCSTDERPAMPEDQQPACVLSFTSLAGEGRAFRSTVVSDSSTAHHRNAQKKRCSSLPDIAPSSSPPKTLSSFLNRPSSTSEMLSANIRQAVGITNHMPATALPRGVRAKRRCSVTKFSFDTAIFPGIRKELKEQQQQS